MNWSEIPLLEHIELLDEQCDIYVHTKDQRVIGLRDVRTNPYLDNTGFYVDHMAMGLNFSFFLPREDFSHIEYRYSQREGVPRESKTDFDELNSFIEEQLEGYDDASEVLREP
jgi:type I restriction-modification system DNA methylase subunit